MRGGEGSPGHTLADAPYLTASPTTTARRRGCHKHETEGAGTPPGQICRPDQTPGGQTPGAPSGSRRHQHTDQPMEHLHNSDRCVPDDPFLSADIRRIDDHCDRTAGEWLDAQLAQQGITEELASFKMGVYTRILREEARQNHDIMCFGCALVESRHGDPRNTYCFERVAARWEHLTACGFKRLL